MADLERGRRIAHLRTERHLTQQAVVDRLEAAAEEAGWTPKKAGHRVVTLRGYQGWEEKGGILWDNAKLLAAVYEVDADWLWSGDAKSVTPDVVDALSGGTQMDRMERLLLDVRDRLRAVEGALQDRRRRSA